MMFEEPSGEVAYCEAFGPYPANWRGQSYALPTAPIRRGKGLDRHPFPSSVTIWGRDAATKTLFEVATKLNLSGNDPKEL